MMVFMTFVVSLTQSNAMYPTSDMASHLTSDTDSLTHIFQKTLQATGIAFNVILVRSSARRDKQFTVFDQNERTTITDQHTAGSSTLGSIGFTSGQIKSHDVELAVNTVTSDDKRSSQTDFYPGGIKVTKDIVHS